MWTLPRKTVCAIAPPIIAAAMLSRKLEPTNTSTSSRKAPFQSSGKVGRQDRGHLALLEQVGQQGEAEEEQQQVHQDHPLVLQVQAEAGQAGAGLERRPQHFVKRDDDRPGDGDAHRLGVEQGDAGEDAGEQDEFDRRHGRVSLHRGSRQARLSGAARCGRPGLPSGRARSSVGVVLPAVRDSRACSWQSACLGSPQGAADRRRPRADRPGKSRQCLTLFW